VVGQIQRGAIPIHRIAPRLAARITLWVMNKIAVLPQPEPDTTGNIFEPQPELNRIDGGWRSGKASR
jgi:hypothetical protein